MAIQTRQHLNFLPPQIVPRRDSMNSSNQGSSALAYMLQKGSLGGPVVGKRTRDSMDHMNSVSRFPSFVGEGEVFRQVQQYEFDVDSILSQHTKKIKLELEESQRNHARMVVGAIREGVMKKLNEKDEQIQRIDKLNSLLQQRLKSLFVENQLYRNMALANEAMANSLRTNLEQLLVANVNNKHHSAGTGPRAVAEDTESCCGSNGNYERDRRTAEKEERMCKRCGEKESCVLLLPCRHLCLCAVCGRGSDQLKACQVCNTHTSATLHVNMSS